MKEQLIRDYLIGTGANIFPEFEIDIMCDTGGSIMFRECEPEKFGAFEQHTVNLFDVVAWAYANRKDV